MTGGIGALYFTGDERLWSLGVVFCLAFLYFVVFFLLDYQLSSVKSLFFHHFLFVLCHVHWGALRSSVDHTERDREREREEKPEEPRLRTRRGGDHVAARHAAYK